MLKRLFLTLALCLCIIAPAQGLNIIWVCTSIDNLADGLNDDHEWPEWLQSLGHTVDYTKDKWNAVTTDQVALLNAADVIVISRAMGSSTLATNAAELSTWNAIKKPVINLNGYAARSSTSKWLNSTTINNVVAPKMLVKVPTNPIFAGVGLDGSSQLDAVTGYTGTSSTSFCGTTDVGNGTVLATTADGANPWIVEWKVGAPYYATSGDNNASKRLLFIAGTWEVGGYPTGALNLTDAGKKMFINALYYVTGMNQDPGVASNPQPAAGATDVYNNSDLSWTVGPNTVSQKVYFGAVFADVNTAASSALLGTVPAATNTLDVGTMPFSTGYYWRVDEIDSSGTLHKGTVWSFTVEAKSTAMKTTNLATIIKATASAQASTIEDPNCTVNASGLTGDTHGVDNKTMWVTPKASLGGKLPQWIKYDFDKVYRLDQMWVWNYNISTEDESGLGAKDVTIEYSVDGSNWAALGNYQFADGTMEDKYAHNTEVSFKGIAAKSVRLTITSSWISPNQTGLSEVRFFYVPVWAREPKPATGATGVDPTQTTLTWRPGREAVTHNVMIGTDPNALTLAGSSAAASFTPTTLGVGTKYYWRIDEVNAATSPNLWTGTLWDFTTPNFLAIDDMESYTDVKGQAIFNIWVDGYNTTSNGGLIGYDPPAACMEKTIIHGGKQSTPFRYGQNTAPSSEASLSFATAKDWTVANANTLRIWVRGRTDNVPTAATIPASTSSFVISAGGTDIYQATDQFRFVYRTLTGDGSITAKIEAQQPTNQYAKAGVMMRVGTDTGAMEVHMVTMPNTPNTTATPKQVEWNYRIATADANAHTLAITPAIQPSTWVRITRKGDVFTGEYSADGVTWTSASLTTTPQTIPMGSTLNVGVLVCSHVAGTLGMAMFSNVKVTGNVGAADWQKTDIGWTFDATTVVNTADTFYVTVSDGSTTKTVIPTLPIPATSVGLWQAADVPFSQFTGVKMNAVKQLTIGVGDKNRSTNPGPGQIFIDDIGVGHPAQ
jgi:regulation of enolase protein 1 (concanavalin A-like superfamily)